MMVVLEVIDKSGRKIYLTDERWKHILKHPEMQDKQAIERIKESLVKPLKVVDVDEDVKYYYKYYKNMKSKAKYLRTIVKYLNGEGFVISSYFIEKMP